MKRETQNSWLIKHFKSGRTITTLHAGRVGITNLPKRICELQELGHEFSKTWKKVRTRYGNGKVMVKEYGIGK